MPNVKNNSDSTSGTSATVGYEAQLWQMADALRDIDSGQIAQGETFHNDRHLDLKADFILANPPARGGEDLLGDEPGQYGSMSSNQSGEAASSHETDARPE